MASVSSKLLLAAIVLLAAAVPARVSAYDPTAPRAPVCAIKGSDGEVTQVVSKTITVGSTTAVETVSVQSPNFVITVDFSVGTYQPVVGDTVIQYTFFEEEANSTTWAASVGRNCNPPDNGLHFFVLWGGSSASSAQTLPDGTTLVFSGRKVTITQPMRTAKLPWWGTSVPLDSFCLHNKPGGARLATRVYKKSTVSTSGTVPACVADSKALDSLLPFSFVCDCNTGGGGASPPPRGGASPPPAPAFQPPCGINGSNGVITDTLYDTAPITDGGVPQGDAVVSLKLVGSNFVINVDFGSTNYIPVFGSTVFQYYYFESAADAKNWTDSGNATRCNPGKDGLFFFIKWGSTTAPTAPDGTTISYTATTATITQPIITKKVPFLGGNNTINNVCLHNKEGGTRLAYRIYTKQGVEDTDANYPGTFPSCAGLLSGGPANQIAFTWRCECPPNNGGGAPPPVRPRSPPPGVCPSSSPPCQFASDSGLVNTVSQAFPLIGGGNATVTLGLSGVYSDTPAFRITVAFNSFTPIQGTTYIQYKFFEGYNTPVNQPPGFTGGFNVQLAGNGSNCDANNDSLYYSIKQGATTVYGYSTAIPAPPITYTAKSLSWTAPIKDASYPAFNLDTAALKKLCCNQKDGGTVFGIRIFNAPATTGKAPCPEDLLALAVGNFNFYWDCSCQASTTRKLMQA